MKWGFIFYCCSMFRENPESAFLRKFYGKNLDNLIKLRQKRQKIQAERFHSASTIKKISRPSSQLHVSKPKKQHYSLERPTTQKKLLKQLSNQLTQIQQQIANLSRSASRKPTRKGLKVLTEPTQDPKNKIYKHVLGQIEEIKKKTQGVVQPQRQPKIMPQEAIMFYGVDFIDGVQFKIKVKIEAGRYYLMAKNAHAKLMLEMPVEEYVQLNSSLFKGNPCAIFNYLTIDNDQLKLKIGNRISSKLFKTYLNYY